MNDLETVGRNAGQPGHVHSNLKIHAIRGGRSVKLVAVMCLLAFAGCAAQAQVEDDLTAKMRLFPGIGAGLRAIKRGADGRMYVLASPALGMAVFDSAGKQILSIGPGGGGTSAAKPGKPSIVFGEDFDVDAQGDIFIADRGANQVLVFSPTGELMKSIPVNSPLSIVALPEGEIAVATLRQAHLVIVFDKNGREIREFGDPEPLADRPDLNRYLSVGQLETDGQGTLYYGFGFMPEPTVRPYDRHGYAGQDIVYSGLDAMPEAQAARKEIERLERKGGTPFFKRILTAVGIDQGNGEVWMALGNTLLHFDKDGNRRATYKLYTPEGARLEANAILVDKDFLIVGSDPLGIYEFERSDNKPKK
jgi:hypothetical protein